VTHHVAALGGLVRAGDSAAVLIEGDSGFGKTTLIEDTAAALPDFHLVPLRCGPQGAGTDHVASLLGRSPAAAAASATIGDAVLDRLEAQAPCLVTVDDLQLADDRCAQVLAHVVHRARRGVLFVCAMHRRPASYPSGEVPTVVDALISKRRSARVQLAEWHPADVVALLAACGVGTRPADLATRICDYTGGAPALTRAVVDDLATCRAAETHQLTPPEGVTHAINAVLASLGRDARSLAEALAVLDTTSALNTAAEIAGVRDATTALEALLGAGLAWWTPTDVTTPVALRYPIYHDAIYAALSPSRRRGLHLAAAANTADSRVWLHRVAATTQPDPMLARDLADAAADELTDATRAAELLRWASEVVGDPVARERHLLDAAVQLLRARRFTELEQLRPQLHALAPSAERNLVLGTASRAQGDLGAAERLLAAAGQAADATASPEIAIRAKLALASIYALQDRPAAQQRVAEQLALLRNLSGASRDWVRVFIADAAGRHGGDALAALRSLDIDGHDAAGATPAQDSAILLSARGLWRVQSGQFTAGANDLREALGCGGTAAQALPVVAGLAWAQYAVGAWDSALTTVDYGAHTTEDEFHSWPDIPLLSLQVCIDGSRGNIAAARELLGHAQTYAAGVPVRACRIQLSLAGATLAQAEGDHAGMARVISQIPDRGEAAGEVGLHQVWWRPLEVEALIGTGQFRAAAIALDKLTDLSQSIGCLRTPAAWLAGCLAEAVGDTSTAEDRYGEAVAEPVEPDTLWLYRARAEQSYGQLLLVARRERRAAVKWLREAAERYLMLGAAPYLDRVAAVLSASGLDGRSAAAGREHGNRLVVLSERERKVAHLVGSGLTNKEASRELFLSPKTIEYHLGNIFTKLGISSRNELRSIVRTAAPSAC
jgi:ATP/maltotriose-dependent transcriptional regulator MalT